MVENAIQNGVASPGRPGTTVFRDLVNKFSVVTDSETGKVVTVF